MIERRDEMDKYTITVENLIDRTARQKISKDMKELNIIHEQNLNYIYRTTNKSRIHILFECPQYIYQGIHYILGHKTNLNTFKRTETIQSVFFDHEGIRLETNIRKVTEKSPNTQIVNNSLLNNPCQKGSLKGN